jgi:hypothetical protein
MVKLAQALLESFGVELEPTDVVLIEQNYCEPTIVDVVIIDGNTKEKTTFGCFDISKGVFPC